MYTFGRKQAFDCKGLQYVRQQTDCWEDVIKQVDYTVQQLKESLSLKNKERLRIFHGQGCEYFNMKTRAKIQYASNL